MEETKKKPATAPVKTIRHGAIAASIWKRQATSGFEYFDFTVSRSWKTTSTGKEGYSSSFFVRNADELQAVIQEAADWIESQQASCRKATTSKLRRSCRKQRRPECPR
jgi:hypothetical protein